MARAGEQLQAGVGDEGVRGDPVRSGDHRVTLTPDDQRRHALSKIEAIGRADPLADEALVHARLGEDLTIQIDARANQSVHDLVASFQVLDSANLGVAEGREPIGSIARAFAIALAID